MKDKKSKKKNNSYQEYPERSGFSGLKGRAHNPALGLREKRISCLTSCEGKTKLESFAENTKMSQGEFLLRLLLSEEAKSFVKRLSVN